MKYLAAVVTLIILFSINTFSQQIVRGYSAGYSYGFLSYTTGDNFSIKAISNNGETLTTYTGSVRKARGTSIVLGFPFEWGHNRHRVELLPGASFVTADYFLNANFNSSPIDLGSEKDFTSIRAFYIMPQVGMAYKFHFGIGAIHLALSAGVDVRFPVMSDYSLRFKKSDYLETDNTIEDITFDFQNAASMSSMVDYAPHLSPKAGLDIYLSRWLVLSFQYYRTPLTVSNSDASIVGYGLAKMTYLVPMGKDDRIRSLQQYKNQ
jgi:hypothetical protein